MAIEGRLIGVSGRPKTRQTPGGPDRRQHRPVPRLPRWFRRRWRERKRRRLHADQRRRADTSDFEGAAAGGGGGRRRRPFCPRRRPRQRRSRRGASCASLIGRCSSSGEHPASDMARSRTLIDSNRPRTARGRSRPPAQVHARQRRDRRLQGPRPAASLPSTGNARAPGHRTSRRHQRTALGGGEAGARDRRCCRVGEP